MTALDHLSFELVAVGSIWPNREVRPIRAGVDFVESRELIGQHAPIYVGVDDVLERGGVLDLNVVL